MSRKPISIDCRVGRKARTIQDAVSDGKWSRVECWQCRSFYEPSISEIKVASLNKYPMFLCGQCADAIPVAK